MFMRFIPFSVALVILIAHAFTAPARVQAQNPDVISPSNNLNDCLTTDGDVTANPVIRSHSCDSSPNQLWLVRGDNKWQVSANASYCLARVSSDSWTLITKLCTDALAIRIVPSAANPRVYVLADDADVALDNYGASIGLYSRHGGASQQWRWFAEDLARVNANPSVASVYPLSKTNTAGYELELARDRVARMLPPSSAPASAQRDPAVFPGLVPITAPLSSQTVQFDLRFKNHDYLRMAAPPENWQATGLYAAPNQPITVTVSGAAADELREVRMRIGAQTDVLYPDSDNVVESGEFLRFPSVSLAVGLKPGENIIRSPYGGAIILQSGASVSKTLDVTIANAVQAPYFVAGSTTEAQWLTRRNTPAPWAVIESALAVAHVPADEVRGLSYSDILSAALHLSHVTELHNELAGLSDSAALPHQTPQGKQWHVEDAQIALGSAHSSFPIMYDNTWQIAAPSKYAYKSAGWGIWHEVGHNYQSDAWSYVFGTESSVNLFSLHAQARLFGNSRVVDENEYIKALALLNDASKPNKWDSADVFGQLVFLDQLRLGFPNLDQSLWTQVMRRYRELSPSEIAALNTDPKKRDQFLRTLCDVTGTNVSPHFTAWALPVSAQATSDCAAKPPMPQRPWQIDGAQPMRPGAGDGQMTREMWTGLPGTQVISLTQSPRYPAQPDSRGVVTGSLETPKNVGDDFGARLRGFLLPPETGMYVFWIAGDESGTFALSTDETEANLRPLLALSRTTDLRGFDEYETWFQKSVTVSLQAGRGYYFEALQKEDFGSDHLSIAWQVPAGSGFAAEPRKVIAARYLSLRAPAAPPQRKVYMPIVLR